MTAPIWLQHYDEGTPPTLEPYPLRTLLDYLSEAALKWPDRSRRDPLPWFEPKLAAEERSWEV